MRGEDARMRPIMLFCETVNICNAGCVFCPYSAQTRPRGFMKAELFEGVLNQYRQIGGGYLTLTPMVGDALLDRDWMQRIRLLGEMRDRIIPSVTTNLYALDKYSDHEVLGMLKVLRRIHISCYGITPEECEAITRRRVFDRFLSQTCRLLNLRQESDVDCDVRIGFRCLRHDRERSWNPLSASTSEACCRSEPQPPTQTGAIPCMANFLETRRGLLLAPMNQRVSCCH